jgi:hypothetical protein
MTGRTSGPSATRATAGGRPSTPRAGAGAETSPDVRAAKIRLLLEDLHRKQRRRRIRWTLYVIAALLLGALVGEGLKAVGLL